jgi:hypothetical protein
VGQAIAFCRLPSVPGWQATKNDGLPHNLDYSRPGLVGPLGR